MIPVKEEKGGLVFYVHVHPGASRRAAGGEHAGALKVSVSAPPEGGAANREVVKLVAGLLGLRSSQVSIAGGAKSRRKKVRVEGADRAAVELRLQELAG